MSKASFTRILVLAPLRWGHRGQPGPHHSDAGKQRIESGYTVLNCSPGCGRGGFKNVKTSGTHPGRTGLRNNTGLFQSITGMKSISTVRPQGETVANRHELCPRWRYRESQLGHGVTEKSRRSPDLPVELRFGTVAADECR